MLDGQAVTVVVALVVQSAALGIWGGKIHTLVKRHDRTIDMLTRNQHLHGEHLVGLDSRMGHVEREMERGK